MLKQKRDRWFHFYICGQMDSKKCKKYTKTQQILSKKLTAYIKLTDWIASQANIDIQMAD